MKPALTKKQETILTFIRDGILMNGFPPTLREIGKRFRIRSTNGVNDHLKALEKKGYIKRQAEKSRAIEILDELRGKISKLSLISVPVLGRIAAGSPILAIENIEGSIQVDKSLISGDGVFAVRVKGESMINDHILDGDYVVIQRQAQADQGEIVAVLIEDEITLKRFFSQKDQIELRPANDTMEPIIIKRGDITKDVKIVGKMVGLVRKA